MADSQFMHGDDPARNTITANSEKVSRQSLVAETPYEAMCSARSTFITAWLQWVETDPGGRQTALESDATVSVLRQLAAFHETVGGDDDR